MTDTAKIDLPLFEEVEIPEAPTRAGIPNPFTDVVKTMTVGGKARTGPVPYLNDDDETSKRAQSRADRQLSEAGDTAGVTVRRTFTDPEKEAHKVTFWVVPKIQRKKDGDTSE